MTRRRTIKVVKGRPTDISTARLEMAQAQLTHAKVTGREAHVSFNFLQRLLNEVLRRRKEEITLMSEVSEILEELVKEEQESARRRILGLDGADDEITELTSADMLPDETDDEHLLREGAISSADLVVPDSSDEYYPDLPEELEINSLSELEPGWVRFNPPKKQKPEPPEPSKPSPVRRRAPQKKKRDRLDWKWPL